MKKIMVLLIIGIIVFIGLLYSKEKSKVTKTDLEDYFKNRYNVEVVLYQGVENDDKNILVEYKAHLSDNEEIIFKVGKKMKEQKSPILPMIFSTEYYDDYSDAVTEYLYQKYSSTITMNSSNELDNVINEIDKIKATIGEERKKYGLGENLYYTKKWKVTVQYKEDTFELEYGPLDNIRKMLEEKIMMYELMHLS